jgi:ketosteroid isomerase-like protein
MYDSFSKKDMPSVLKSLSDEVDWLMGGGNESLPFKSRCHGKEEVLQFFKSLSEVVEVQKLEPREYLSENDTVVVEGHTEARIRSNGRKYDTDWIAKVTFDKGKVVRYRHFMDTAAMLHALNGD